MTNCSGCPKGEVHPTPTPTGQFSWEIQVEVSEELPLALIPAGQQGFPFAYEKGKEEKSKLLGKCHCKWGPLKGATAQIKEPGPPFTCKAGFCYHNQVQICKVPHRNGGAQAWKKMPNKETLGLPVPSHLSHSQVNQDRS